MGKQGLLAVLLLILFAVGCTAPPSVAPERLWGKPISAVIRSLGDPDEVAEGQYFGVKFSKEDGPIAAVFKYSSEQLWVYIGEKGVVLGVARGNSKNFIDK